MMITLRLSSSLPSSAAEGILTFITLITLLISNPADAVVCYRKYHEGKGLCKSYVKKPIDDAKACCSKYGQGYATEMKSDSGNGRWFECTACNVEGEHSKWPAYKSGGKRSASKHSPLSHKISKYWSKSNLVINDQQDTDWSPWSDWGPCSSTCGQGLHQRTRFCLKDHCTGEDFQEKPCPNLAPCLVDGGWTDWLPWQACSVTCSNGSQVRLRSCTNPRPQHGGKNCEGADMEKQVCSLAPCPIDGAWGDWSDWEGCNITCGEGVEIRRRDCNHPLPARGGKGCVGVGVERRPCERICAVDGGWSEWSNWTDCSVTCGDGFKSRSRRCDNPTPQRGGRQCEGLEVESSPCTGRTNCPVNGNWTDWSKVESCTARPCSGEAGFKTRFRSCTNPRPMFGGKSCTGRSWKRERCYNNDFCTEKVDGGWCEWMNWTTCTAGIMKRERSCECPPPVNQGAKCYGVEVEERACYPSEITTSTMPEVKEKNRLNAGPVGCKKDNYNDDEDDDNSSGNDNDVNCNEEKPDVKPDFVQSTVRSHVPSSHDDDDDDEDAVEHGSGI